MRLILALLLSLLPLSANPTLWIIGDSTVKNRTKNQLGWGDPLADHFDSAKIAVKNHAIGGRSSRSFLTEGRWDAVLEEMQEGDYVLIQFGHNDGGSLFSGDRPRASIKGTGHESKTGVVEMSGKEETVHTFGWYIRKYCSEAKAKGATPIVVSLIPRNRRDDDGQVYKDDTTYGLWARQAAKETGAHFIDFNTILADKWTEMGKEAVDKLFDVPDHTHTNAAGAEFNAEVLAELIRDLDSCSLRKHLRKP